MSKEGIQFMDHGHKQSPATIFEIPVVKQYIRSHEVGLATDMLLGAHRKFAMGMKANRYRINQMLYGGGRICNKNNILYGG